jgi:hypothetical protein
MQSVKKFALSSQACPINKYKNIKENALKCNEISVLASNVYYIIYEIMDHYKFLIFIYFKFYCKNNYILILKGEASAFTFFP